MARYRMSDGTIVDTDNSSKNWDEAQDHDGQNWISRHTGTQWNHERLFRSRKGRYYIERSSDWQGTTSACEWISNEEAARWLLLAEVTLPDELATLESEVME